MKRGFAIKALFLCLAILFIIARHAVADIVRLKNGAVFKGKIVRENNKTILLDIGEGKIGFKMNEIESIKKSGRKESKPTTTTKPKLSVDTINSHYYSLVNNGVKNIKFKMTISTERLLLDELDEQNRARLVRTFGKTDIFITYNLSEKSLKKAVDFSVSNKPSFTDRTLNKKTSELTKLARNMAEVFWHIWWPYATKIINEEYFKVESMNTVGKAGDIKVKLVTKEGTESQLLFDSAYRLKSWRSIDIDYSEKPHLELYKSKYLVSSMRSNSFGRIDIIYHSVDGLRVPKKVLFYSRNTSAPDATMSFVDIKRGLLDFF